MTERPSVVLDAPDPVGDALLELQLAIFRHPVAAQAVFRALVAEGRAYARTEEGSRLLERVSRSELAHRGRVIWDVVTMGALTDGPEVLPSVVVDAFLEGVDNDRLEPWLSGLFEEGADGGA